MAHFARKISEVRNEFSGCFGLRICKKGLVQSVLAALSRGGQHHKHHKPRPAPRFSWMQLSIEGKSKSLRSPCPLWLSHGIAMFFMQHPVTNAFNGEARQQNAQVKRCLSLGVRFNEALLRMTFIASS